MSQYWKLEGRKPVVTDLMTWAKTFDAGRPVGDTTVGGYRVSTVFLGIDHSFGEGPPLLFETMVFGEGPLDQEQERYTAYDEAEAGHARWVEQFETADGTIEDAYHHTSRKADAIRFARHAAKTTVCTDIVRVWVDDTKTDLGVFSAKVER